VLVKWSKWLVVLALCFSIGAHWAVLQSIAWCGMAITYTQSSSLCTGLAETFDGKHPCKLCKMVAEGKKSEKKQAAIKFSKMEPFPISQLNPLFVPPLTPEFSPVDSTLLVRADIPLLPPPRVA